jgi:hypothetical protein
MFYAFCLVFYTVVVMAIVLHLHYNGAMPTTPATSTIQNYLYSTVLPHALQLLYSKTDIPVV